MQTFGAETNEEGTVGSICAPVELRTRKLKCSARDSPVFIRDKLVATRSTNSGDCGRIGRSGIHHFGRTSQGARPPSVHYLDHHEKEAQTRPFEPTDGSTHPRKSHHPAIGPGNNSKNLSRKNRRCCDEIQTVVECDDGRPYVANSSDRTWIMSLCDLGWRLGIRAL
jgi:hypothetical protein